MILPVIACTSLALTVRCGCGSERVDWFQEFYNNSLMCPLTTEFVLSIFFVKVDLFFFFWLCKFEFQHMIPLLYYSYR